MVVSRMFSGFSDSLKAGRWPPAGSPAIYKLLEGVAGDETLNCVLVFTCKDADAGAAFRGQRRLAIGRLGLTATVLGYATPGWWRELRHLCALLLIWLRQRPQVAYFTNANFVAAAVFAHLGLCRVVLRFLGIFPAEKRLAEARRGLARRLYRAPFDHVVCTQEGSGAEYYLPRLLRPGTPLSVLVNGVDKTPAPAERVATLKRRHGLDGAPVVLFLGRLEPYKGCREFVEAMIALFSDGALPGKAVLVGRGSDGAALGQRVRDAGMEDRIVMVGDVAHDRVPDWFAACDVYVSLNRHGNLSNANLEALAAGTCMVLLESDPATHTDLVVDRLIPHDAAPRVSRGDLAGATVRVVGELLRDPGRPARYRDRLAQVSANLLWSWEERVAREIAIMVGAASPEIQGAADMASEPRLGDEAA